MKGVLLELLNRLEQIGNDHEELYDTECRERMSKAVFDGFLRPIDNFMLSSDFGLHSHEANVAVHDALESFLIQANNLSSRFSLSSFRDRLSAFQDESVRSEGGIYYDDVFGYWPAESFNEVGEKIES